MKFGTLDIEKAYLGSTELDKIYLGSTEVYEKGGSSGGGIDANTIALFHFDNSTADSGYYASTSTVSASSYNFSENGKFSQALDGGQIQCTNSSTSWSTASNTLTLDYWLYANDTSTQTAHYIILYLGGSNTPFSVNFYRYSGSYYGNIQYAGNFIVDAQMNAINHGAWNHIAVELSSSKMDLFINGTKIGSYTTNIPPMPLAVQMLYIYGIQPQLFDEVRLSNTLRYNGNFTPPTGPYTQEQ